MKLADDPNYKVLATVAGASQCGPFLRVHCAEDWQPVMGDMFLIASGAEEKATDPHFTVIREPRNEGAVSILEINPPIIPDGRFQNIAASPADGAMLYRPDGELLRAIWKRHLETAR